MLRVALIPDPLPRAVHHLGHFRLAELARVILDLVAVLDLRTRYRVDRSGDPVEGNGLPVAFLLQNMPIFLLPLIGGVERITTIRLRAPVVELIRRRFELVGRPFDRV